MQEYTAKKGYYRHRELNLLATSLGFPGKLFVNQLSAHYTEIGLETGEQTAALSEKLVTRLLGSGVLFKKLEKVFNEYPAWYNVKLVRKAMQHIRHRSLTFSDISLCRIAFQLYACEDESGLPAELSHVQRALKMLERVMSPSQLHVEIQRFNEVSDVPSRLQLYEFMDIVAACRKTDEVEDERRLSEISLSDSGVSSRELNVEGFDQMLMTNDERVRAYLESNYQHSRHKGKDQSPPELDPDHIVHTDSRKSLVSLAAEQARAVTPCLERSQSQLHASRSGFCTLSHDHFKSLTTSHLPLSTPSLPASRTHSRSIRSRRQCIFSATEDPLTKAVEVNRTFTSRTPVRFHLQNRKKKKPATTAPSTTKADSRAATPSEGLGKTINDTCADSVLRARETLHSSMSLISPHDGSSLPLEDTESVSATHNNTSGSYRERRFCCTYPSSSSVPTHTPVVRVKRRDRSSSGLHGVEFHLEPIVRQEDKEDHQFLIDSLLWSTWRSKHRYQVIE